MTGDQRDEFEARHQRQLMLMRMMGETNRMERRAQWFMAFAVVLAVLALCFAAF